MLGKKMVGLNANTTASRTADTTFQNIPDFLNEYGDIVTAQIMAEETELHAALGYPLKAKDKGMDREDAVRKVTGRIPMLPLKEQHALYERIEADYKELITQLEATGGSALEAKTLPLDARLVESSELTPAREDVESDSPFASESRLGLFDVKVLGKPYTPEQVEAMIAKGREAAPDMESVRKHTLEWLNKKLETIENEETRESLRERTNGQYQTVQGIVDELPVGKAVYLNTVDAAFTGVVTRVDYKGKGNPSAPSSWRVTVAVADAAKQITVPFSKVQLDAGEEISVGGALIRGSDNLDLKTAMDAFASGQTAKREKRYIAFGNVLTAYASVGSQGQVINFEDSDGNVRAGILYKKDATKDSLLGAPAVSLDVLALKDALKQIDIIMPIRVSFNKFYGAYMKNYSQLFLLAMLSFSVAGCVVKDHIDFAYIPTQNKAIDSDTYYSVAVLVSDERPDIVLGEKEPYFIGIFKNTFGVPHDARTIKETSFAGDVQRDLENDLRASGINVSKNFPDRILAVSIQEYNFNCYRDCRVWHNLLVQIKDPAGNILHTKVIRDDRDVLHYNQFVGPQSTMRKEMPKIYAQMLRNIATNDAEAMSALKRTPQ